MTLTLPSSVGTVAYELRGIIYAGGYHYNTRLADGSGSLWQYDNQVGGGQPVFDPEGSIAFKSNGSTTLAPLMHFGEQSAHLLVYALCTS
jgi:hypothetical protein